MPLVTSTEMFKKAYEGGYAIGAFNVNNMEIIQGITEAAMEENAPLILQVSSGARNYAKHVYLMKLIEAAIEDTGLPICVHLDHGDTFELCKSCIDGGFTSVMIDGSHHSFEDNIALTKQVVDYAHAKGVVVEGELGRLAAVFYTKMPRWAYTRSRCFYPFPRTNASTRCFGSNTHFIGRLPNGQPSCRAKRTFV